MDRSELAKVVAWDVSGLNSRGIVQVSLKRRRQTAKGVIICVAFLFLQLLVISVGQSHFSFWPTHFLTHFVSLTKGWLKVILKSVELFSNNKASVGL